MFGSRHVSVVVLLNLLANKALGANKFNLCSSANTGSGSDSTYSIYQSYGACSGSCSGYAVAILQDFECWCSNDVPADSVTLDLCSVDSCPGYPDDPCGNEAKGYYGYIYLSTPSSTVSSDSSTTAESSTSSSTSSIETSSKGMSSSSTTSTTLSSTSSRTSISTTTISSTSSTQTSSSSTITSTLDTNTVMSSTAAASVIISVQTITDATKTMFITQTVSTQQISSTGSSAAVSSTSESSSNNSSNTSPSKSSSDSFWHSHGKVAGVFTAVGLVLLFLLILLILCLRKRRKDDKGTDSAPHTPSIGGAGGSLRKYGFVPQRRRRSTSTLVLASNGESEKSSQMGNLASGSKTFTFPGQYGAPPPPAAFKVDQRIDPGTMYMQYHDNYSRGSLRDEYDYSRRVLKVLNPDDE
ncbi:hypothetical protein V1511DRAFT_457787 [Dipodascopsis uninucleata]